MGLCWVCCVVCGDDVIESPRHREADEAVSGVMSIPVASLTTSIAYLVLVQDVYDVQVPGTGAAPPAGVPKIPLANKYHRSINISTGLRRINRLNAAQLREIEGETLTWVVVTCGARKFLWRSIG